jgi:Na+/H+-translocating membrane pyrophosphatase
LHFAFASTGGLHVLAASDIPMLLVGYGFGASFVALFMQLGGGIYTKVSYSIQSNVVSKTRWLDLYLTATIYSML